MLLAAPRCHVQRSQLGPHPGVTQLLDQLLHREVVSQHLKRLRSILCHCIVLYTRTKRQSGDNGHMVLSQTRICTRSRMLSVANGRSPTTNKLYTDGWVSTMSKPTAVTVRMFSDLPAVCASASLSLHGLPDRIIGNKHRCHRVGQACLLQNKRRSSDTGLAHVACSRTLCRC